MGLEVDEGLRLAADEASLFDLKEEFERLKVAAGFGYRLSPSIKPMTAEQNTVGFWVGVEGGGELGGKRGVVLRVFENGDAFEVRVGGDAGEALENLVSREGDVAKGGAAGGDEGVPDGVDVEDGAGVGAGAIEDEVEAGLGGGLACAGEDAAAVVDF